MDALLRDAAARGGAPGLAPAFPATLLPANQQADTAEELWSKAHAVDRGGGVKASSAACHWSQGPRPAESKMPTPSPRCEHSRCSPHSKAPLLSCPTLSAVVSAYAASRSQPPNRNF